MHELSIACELVRVAEQAARAERAQKVTAVFLRLGALAGVVRESLEFAWDLATEGSLLAGAKLIVEPVALAARCDTCEQVVQPESPPILRCPHCGNYTPDLLAGRELQLRALDIERAPVDAATAPASTPR